MKILEFLNEKAITADIKADTKKDVIKELLDLLVKTGDVKNEDEILKVLMNREALGSTGIGQGVGIPHGKTNQVKKLVAAFGLSKNGVNFESLDGEPAYIFFLLIAPEDSAGPHLKALARISRLLRDKFFREELKNCKNEKEIVMRIKKEDQKHY